MYHDISGLARVKHSDFQRHIEQAHLASQAQDVERIEYARFRQAYQLRSLVNRFAPALAPRLGL